MGINDSGSTKCDLVDPPSFPEVNLKKARQCGARFPEVRPQGINKIDARWRRGERCGERETNEWAMRRVREECGAINDATREGGIRPARRK